MMNHAREKKKRRLSIKQRNHSLYYDTVACKYTLDTACGGVHRGNTHYSGFVDRSNNILVRVLNKKKKCHSSSNIDAAHLWLMNSYGKSRQLYMIISRAFAQCMSNVCLPRVYVKWVFGVM